MREREWQPYGMDEGRCDAIMGLQRLVAPSGIASCSMIDSALLLNTHRYD